MEIRVLHFRQRQPKNTQLNTGMLSYGLIAVLQTGQCDAGSTIDSALGMRRMQTFKKLPTTMPNRKKITGTTC